LHSKNASGAYGYPHNPFMVLHCGHCNCQVPTSATATHLCRQQEQTAGPDRWGRRSLRLIISAIAPRVLVRVGVRVLLLLHLLGVDQCGPRPHARSHLFLDGVLRLLVVQIGDVGPA
jgi:hypothetical protein